MQVGAQLRASVQEKLQNERKKKMGSQFDHTKPIFIHNGEDNIKSMNLPGSGSGSMNTIEVLKKQLGQLFGVEEAKKKEPIDLSKYGEARIDNIIGEKKRVSNFSLFRNLSVSQRCCKIQKHELKRKWRSD